MVATRPVSGAPIASAWGDEVHDVVEQAIACIASAPSTATQNAAIALTAVVEGKASMLSAGGVVVPQAGLYTVEAVGTIAGLAGPGIVRLGLYVNGADSGQGGGNIPAQSGTHRWALPIMPLKLFAAGDKLQPTFNVAGATGTPAFIVERFTVRLVAQAYAP